MDHATHPSPVTPKVNMPAVAQVYKASSGLSVISLQAKKVFLLKVLEENQLVQCVDLLVDLGSLKKQK